MNDISQAIHTAFTLLIQLDTGLVEIVRRSLAVSLSAVGFASLIGLPLGGAIALFRFPGRRPLAVLISALMGLPPVVVGLFVYLVLDKARSNLALARRAAQESEQSLTL